jgi:Putative heavy-metal-binding
MYQAIMIESRNQARQRLADAAGNAGANAVVAMRFDSHDLSDVMTQIVAYGDRGDHRQNVDGAARGRFRPGVGLPPTPPQGVG